MKRFLVIGCGGSGGAILAYMMDQLRSDLGRFGVDRLPAGWQFLHIDVPAGPEKGPDGLGNVIIQGGRYLGCGPQGGSYGLLDNAVSGMLGQLDVIGTWAPRDPENVPIPISVGAGQYRALGRMIILSRAAQIQNQLNDAWQQLLRVETSQEMAGLRVPGLGQYNAQDDPLILVVSSMAGGAGASMALDVCRLLSLIPGLPVKLTGVFMVSSDIFDTLSPDNRMGVRANALAMLGEIVANQAGAARIHDARMLASLGLQTGDAEPIPFARVFPVGRHIGKQYTLFGDGSPNAVYRGLGRGLAALMMSGEASSQFISYDLGNAGSPPPNGDVLGWGIDNWISGPWGTFGYACVNLGRDRYGEYAAQRIARGAVDRLVEGHLQPSISVSAEDQIKARVANNWNRLCGQLLLPEPAANVRTWLTDTAFNRSETDRIARGIIAGILPAHTLPDPSGQNTRDWLPVLRLRLSERRAQLNDAAGQAAYQWAYSWHTDLEHRILGVVEDAVSQSSLAYALAVLDRLGEHVVTSIVPAVAELAKRGPADVVAISADTESKISLIRGAVGNGQQLLESVLDGFREPLRARIWSHFCSLVEQTCRSLINDLIGPLREALAEALRILETARSAEQSPLVDIGIARLTTTQYLAWPSESDRVPARFEHATNEVLLTSSADFPAQFRSDVKGVFAAPESTLARSASLSAVTHEEARSTVVERAIRGKWTTTGGTLPPGGLLERKEAWIPSVFTVVPGSTQNRNPQRASFDVHVRPAELLDRCRLFVNRPDESFEKFCRVSLRDFVSDKNVTDSQRRERQHALIKAFSTALALARPLAKVSTETVRAVHNVMVEYRYKFSEVPFLGLPLAVDLAAVLDNDPDIDSLSADTLTTALLGDESQVSKIDIFGSYANYLPVAFEGVLRPAAEQWAATPAQGRAGFWRWRRTRPLPAALPMGDVERRAMTAGWFLGQLVGELKIPEPPYDSQVKVWDRDRDRWIPFPHPLLTPPSAFHANYDWLPAVLESVLLAIAHTTQTPVLESLRPYQVLRRIYDDHSQVPAGGILARSSQRTIAGWLSTGKTLSGAPSGVDGVGPSLPMETRAKAATEWLAKIHALAGTHYMAPGEGGGSGAEAATGGGSFSVISRREQASKTPMFRDIAADVYWASRELTNLIVQTQADIVARGGSISGPDRGGHEFAVPDAGTF